MERASGERFDHLMRRLVLEPLGMSGGFEPAEFTRAQLDNLAVLYRKRAGPEDREVWNPEGPWVAQADDYRGTRPAPRAAPGYADRGQRDPLRPAGEPACIAADLARVMRMLMGRGEIDGQRFLRPETVDGVLVRQWRRDDADGSGDYGKRRQLFNAWGLGNQHFTDRSAPGRGDRLIEGGGFTGVGHLGDAYGLNGVFVFDPTKRNGMILLAGGVGADPERQRGAYSANLRYEERILTALHRHILE
jgi:CubicO group peptidase (beta-lactamase class C family)